MFLRECTPHPCPSEFFFLSNLQGWCWTPPVGDTTCSTSLQIKKQRQKRCFIFCVEVWIRCRPVLCWYSVFRCLGGFWQPSSFSSAPQVGFIRGKTSPIGKEASPWAIHLPKSMEVRCLGVSRRDVKKLKIVWGLCLSSLFDEVASMLMSRQSLSMPRGASANVTGLLFGQVKACKWEAIKAYWHASERLKCPWNWRIGKIGRIDIRWKLDWRAGSPFLLLSSVRQDATSGHAQLEGGGIMTSGNVSLTNFSLIFKLATLRTQWWRVKWYPWNLETLAWSVRYGSYVIYRPLPNHESILA